MAGSIIAAFQEAFQRGDTGLVPIVLSCLDEGEKTEDDAMQGDRCYLVGLHPRTVQVLEVEVIEGIQVAELRQALTTVLIQLSPLEKQIIYLLWNDGDVLRVDEVVEKLKQISGCERWGREKRGTFVKKVVANIRNALAGVNLA